MINWFYGLINWASAEASSTEELIAAEMQTLADGVVATIIEILPAVFTVVIVVVSLMVAYRLFRRMVGR